MTEAVKLLSDEEVSRFLALSKQNTGPSFGYTHDLCKAVAALCATVRALRSELHIATDLCHVTTESLRRSESENAALREQLAELQRRNDTQYESIMEYQADVKSLQSQLAQVTQERDAARSSIVRICTHPNTYKLTESSRRCHDCGLEILL